MTGNTLEGMVRGARPVHVLGMLQVDLGGRVLGLGDFGGRRPKQVFETLLLHRGEPVPKDRLVDALWGEHPPKDPMRTLEAYVCGLRRVLESAGRGAGSCGPSRVPTGCRPTRCGWI